MQQYKPNPIVRIVRSCLESIVTPNAKQKLEEIVQRVHFNIMDTKSKLSDLLNTNLTLAIYHYEEGNFSDAIMRFHLIIFFHKNTQREFPIISYYLGRCYFEKFQFSKAEHWFQQYLESEPQELLDETEYCLRVIRLCLGLEDWTTARDITIPLGVIRHRFNVLASDYNNILKKAGDIPQKVLCDILHAAINSSSRVLGLNILDLGCGTGIIGMICHYYRFASNIVGVDISPKMVEMAQDLHVDADVYIRVVENDVASFLRFSAQKELTYDAIIASDLLSYYSDLDELFSYSAIIAAPAAFLAITFKEGEDVDSVAFIPEKQEFVYYPKYVLELAATRNWRLHTEQEISYVTGEAGWAMVFCYNDEIEEQESK